MPFAAALVLFLLAPSPDAFEPASRTQQECTTHKSNRECKTPCILLSDHQEGDSFLLVFHDAMDAVSFCLQARAALGLTGRLTTLLPCITP